MAASAVLCDDPAGAGSASEFAHLPSEGGRLDVKRLGKFSGRDELPTALVEIGT